MRMRSIFRFLYLISFLFVSMSYANTLTVQNNSLCSIYFTTTHYNLLPYSNNTGYLSIGPNSSASLYADLDNDPNSALFFMIYSSPDNTLVAYGSLQHHTD